MKKSLLTLALLSSAAGSVVAQDLKLGLKVGPTFSTISGPDKGSSSGYLVGVNAGATLNLGLTDMLSLQPELLYSTKGTHFSNGQGDIRSQYLDVPILLRIDAAGPFFELGPQVGFLFNARQSPDNAPSFNLGYREVDLGVVAGVGYQLENGLSLGVRYNAGLSKLLVEEAASNRIYNTAFMLQLGYRFNDL